MDLLEWVFQKVAKRQRAKSKDEADLFAVYVDEEIFSLKSILSFILEGESIPIQTGRGIGRVAADKIVLPETIRYFSCRELNRSLLLHKTLVAGMIHREKLCYSSSSLSYAEKTLEILAFEEKIVHSLDILFPQFFLLHQNLKIQLDQLTGSEEREFFQLKKSKNAADFFRWQRFPARALALWMEPMPKESLAVAALPHAAPLGRAEASEEKKTEDEGESSTEAPQEISLKEKEKEQSPVFHSFEKLETADEYNGGSRVTDAEDDLDDHADALAELNMKHVTREGGAAGSIYKAHFSELFGLHIGRVPPARYPKFKWMPEWNYKNQSFLKDHCRLYLLDSENKNEANEPKKNFKADLEKKYAAEILLWKQKISSLVCERSWKDRQVDGEEWDIDAYSKYMADVKSCGMGDNKIFSRRASAKRSFQVCILMDLSLSSDSWVQNKRILDIQLEAVGLCGILLEELSDTVSVLGAWSETRHHCYLAPIKKQESSWDSFFENTSHISPRGYTRLGPAIREAVSSLRATKAKKKLLVLITDGKPTDLDHYEGKYGIEDMRHSLVEAQQAGVFVQALAVDQGAKAHFPQLFNKDKYRILSDPKLLPEQLYKIYFDFVRSR